MTAMPITAPAARELMGTAMDARSLNMWQTQALLNDTPEVDCVIDHLAVLVTSGVKPSAVADLLRLTRRILESNLAEGQHEMDIAGALDDLASRLHDLEMNSGQRRELTVKELGRALRDALPVLADRADHTVARVVEAGAVVDRILAQVPASQLFTPSVHRELRDTNYRRLVDLWAERHQEERAA